MRDALPKLKELGVSAVGISPDPPAQQKKFDDKYGLGFPLLSDADHAISDAYGVWGEKKMNGKSYVGVLRSAFLIDAAGGVEQAWYQISPQDTVPALLQVLEGLQA
ncbi:MAG: redoxin domain-containing protein [Desulfatitalea sp.]|nr:redoxin domain-containing protein [Desulfatitalea sp.]